jgi:cytochrome c oxidase subunit I
VRAIPSQGSLPGMPVDYLRVGATARSWLLSTDHKRVAVLYFFAVSLALVAGGMFAMVLRLELLTPGRTFMAASTYNQLFTQHGVIMVFLFMIPAIPSVFGNFMLPIMIGADDLAFPRLNLASFYVYLLGAGITLVGMFAGGADSGWTFYTPYSTSSLSAIAPVATGVFVVGVSSIMTGINFIATTHAMRAKGIGWMKLPLFVWAIYATSIIQVLATPVLGMALALVGLDRIWQIGIFDPAIGGDPLLFQHLFWFYSHPAVYIMILPAMGVISEVVCTFSRNGPYSYRAIAMSSLGIAFVGFLTWGHHMFTAGMSVFDAGVFGLLSMLVAVFSAIKVFTWTLTLRGGRIALQTPMVYFLGFVFLFVFGGMTGVAVATSSLDVHWHDTYFVVAHFHFIMVGGTLMGFLAALHYWFPKITGRRYGERAGMVAALGVFGGFVFTFTPQFLLGNAGMPRRYYSYPDEFQWLNVLSTAGASILFFGLCLVAINLLVALFAGSRADGNVWRSRSYEWLSTSPPPAKNWVTRPAFERGPYDYQLPPEHP